MEKKDYAALRTGKKAFDAWQRGEYTGNYDAFKKVVAPDFNLFANPLKGRFFGEDAPKALRELIAERESNRNSLTFSGVTSFVTGKRVGFQFDLSGTIKNGSQNYKSYHLIVFEVDDIRDLITGFSEYFGTLDSGWLK